MADVAPPPADIALVGDRLAWAAPVNHNRELVRVATPGSAAAPADIVTAAPKGPHVVGLALAGSSRALAVTERVSPYDIFDR
ncbi:MAG TPA: hypothetical protein VIL49_16025, partial [Capillimicrobium sp.]